MRTREPDEPLLPDIVLSEAASAEEEEELLFEEAFCVVFVMELLVAGLFEVLAVLLEEEDDVKRPESMLERSLAVVSLPVDEVEFVLRLRVVVKSCCSCSVMLPEVSCIVIS